MPNASVYFVKFARIASIRRFLDELRRLEVGLARAEVDDVHAAPAKRGGGAQDLERGRPRDGGDPPREPERHSFGPAATTSAGVSPSNFRKFSMKRAASCLYFCMYCALSGHDSAGRSTWSGTPGQVFGT